MSWWRCPNDPPCPHGAVLHDIEDYDDDRPRCCAEGCDCGAPDGDRRYAEDIHRASRRRPTLAEDLAELARTNPDVAAAEAELDRVKAAIANKP